MTNILLVDDVEDNNIVLEMLIEEYIEENGLDESAYSIASVMDSNEGLELVIKEKFDIVFLDIMMPKLDGLSFLKILRETKDIHQPIVVMSTALGDQSTIAKERKYGANAYMLKPYSIKVVSIMLNKYLEVLAQNSFQIEDEFDFDFDFDDTVEESNDEKDPLEYILQKHYKPMSAIELIDAHAWNIESIEEDIEDLNMLVLKVFESREEEISLKIESQNVVNIFNAYRDFFGKFEELTDLYHIINAIIELIEQIELSSMEESKENLISAIITAIVFDLEDFKQKVFDEENIKSIYYFNASIVSSYLEMKGYLNN